MTRQEKELKLLSLVFNSNNFLTDLEKDWNAIYKKIKECGWESLSDLHISLLYSWWFE